MICFVLWAFITRKTISHILKAQCFAQCAVQAYILGMIMGETIVQILWILHIVLCWFILFVSFLVVHNICFGWLKIFTVAHYCVKVHNVWAGTFEPPQIYEQSWKLWVNTNIMNHQYIARHHKIMSQQTVKTWRSS